MDEFAPHNPDIFISYAHIDNEEPPEWVDEFASLLHRKVMVRLGSRPRIWRDHLRLSGNDQLEKIIIPAVRKSMVIVSVISPGYVASDWCRKELHAFCEAHPPDDLSLRGKSRVFKVVKLPPDDLTELGTMPELLDTTGDEFFSNNGKKDVSLEPSRDAERFKDKVDDVALAIVQILGALLGHDVDLAPSGLTVYLAPSTYDLRAQRESLRNALRLDGHIVLETDPVFTDDYERRVRSQIEKCDLSIHPIGDNYAMLENSEHLVEAAAYTYAGEHAKTHPEFLRITWRNSKAPPDERKREFVKQLADDVELENMQYVVMPLEDLKSYVKECAAAILAQRSETRTAQRANAPARRKTVYLAWDPMTDCAPGTPGAVTVAAVRRYLFDQGFDVKKRLSGSDSEKADDVHRRMLRLCDGVLLYQGDADPAWVESMVADLADPAVGRGFGHGGYDACAVLFGPPPSGYKSEYLDHDVPAIPVAGSFDPASLDDFIAALRARSAVTP